MKVCPAGVKCLLLPFGYHTAQSKYLKLELRLAAVHTQMKLLAALSGISQTQAMDGNQGGERALTIKLMATRANIYILSRKPCMKTNLS